MKKDSTNSITSKESFDAVAKLLTSLAENANDVNALLKSTAEYYDADRGYVFEITPDGTMVDNTYEWCREGVSAEIDNLQNVPIESVELWIKEFEKSGAFYISSLDTDVEKSSLTYEVLEPQGIESLITAPLYHESVISGFVGIDNPRKNIQDLTVLKTVASIIYSDIIRTIAEKKEKETAESMQNRFFASTFLNTFESAYYINLQDNSFLTLRQKEYLHEDYSYQTDWYEMITKYADEGINPKDRSLYDVVCDPALLRAQIEKEQEYHVVFRDISVGYERYCSMYVLRGEDLNHAAVAFMDVDAEMKAEEENAIISSMAEDFDYIACINIENSEVTRYRATEKFLNVHALIDQTLPSYLQLNDFFKMVIHPEDMMMFRENADELKVLTALEENEVYKFECRTRHPESGIVEYYRFKFAKVPNNPGLVILGMLNIDTQVRREMKTAALEEEMKYKKQVEQELNVIKGLASDLVSLYTVNLDNGTYRTYAISEEAKEVRPIVESSGTISVSFRSFAEQFLHEEDKEKFLWFADMEHIREALENIRSHKILMRRNYGGVWKWLELNMIKVENVSEPAKNVILAFSNRDEQVRAELEIRQQLADALAEAETANKAKTDFLFSMSHDIRTPMNAITGYTNMAIKHIDEKEKVVDCLDKTQQAGGMLLSLINSVLEVSRIEAGHATLDEQPGDVYLSFSNVETTMRELAETKDISLSFDFKHISDRYVYADFSRALRIFTNIISNAIKYTPEGGKVSVTCEQAGEAENGIATYRYTFTDNGIGMSEDFQQHVFDQFSREQTSTVSGIQGTGLGMSVVKSFVELMGGEITVKSRQGFGTTFTVLLPFRVQKEKLYTDPTSGEVISERTGVDFTRLEDISFKGRKLLLVEDNEMNREIATDILEEAGFIVTAAEDGSIAYDIMIMAKPGDFDVILMDIQMPVMDGYTATKKIRELETGVEVIPIIALSANAFAEDRRKSLEAGMNDHISKPINIAHLKETLAKYL